MQHFDKLRINFFEDCFSISFLNKGEFIDSMLQDGAVKEGDSVVLTFDSANIEDPESGEQVNIDALEVQLLEEGFEAKFWDGDRAIQTEFQAGVLADCRTLELWFEGGTIEDSGGFVHES